VDTVGKTKLVKIGSRNTMVVLGTRRCGAQAHTVNWSVLGNRIALYVARLAYVTSLETSEGQMKQN
jgi:hypothetical protein